MTRNERIDVLHKVPEDKRLAIAMELAGLTQGGVAKLAGMSQPLVSQFQRGYRVPTDEQKAAIAAALDVPADVLWPVSRVA